MVAVARCRTRSKRNLVRLIVFATILAALLTYIRLLWLPINNEKNVVTSEDVMKMYLSDKEEWLEHKIVDYERRVVLNLGRDGEPAYLQGKEKENGENALKTVALNTILCDRVPLNRTLRDPRNKG